MNLLHIIGTMEVLFKIFGSLYVSKTNLYHMQRVKI